MTTGQRLKRLYFRLRGKDPEAIVVTFATGEPELVARVFAEMQQLVPDRRHVLIESAASYGELRRRLRKFRIGLAPVLFTGEPEQRRLRRAAFLLAPTKILAFNGRLERHHLRLSTWIASLLFLKGVPIDRIWLRPSWLCPWKKDRSVYPSEYLDLVGRPFHVGHRRIAIVSPYFPYPLSHGGAVRIFNLIREMAREFDIVLFGFHDEETEQDFAPVLEYCSRAILVKKTRYREPRWASIDPPEVREFQSPTMLRLVDQLRRELRLDAVQVEYTTLAPYRGDVLVAHDVTFALYAQIHRRESSFTSWWNYWRWLRFERRWMPRYRRVIAMSQDDHALIGLPNTDVIPNGVDLARFTPEIERPGSRLLFVGSFRHFPNILAYRFFIEQVWPELSRQCSELRVTVVAGPDPLLYWREHTGLSEIPGDERIQLLGFVSDVRNLYVEANVVIVPTLVSAGTNLKVLEALAMERAVVSTSSGCAGLGLGHGVDLWVADSAQEFTAAILKLLSEPDLRHSIAASGKRCAEREYGWAQIGLRQRSLFRRLIGSKIEVRAAEPSDLDKIWAIQCTSPEASQWHRDDYLAFDCFLAIWDNQPAGFLVSREVAHGEREILNVAVDPEFRRLGVAQALIRSEIERFPGEHFLEVRASNTGAQELYEKLGFQKVGVRPGYYDDPPEAGIVMRFLS
ncbi:MAG: GNAT family N-acetyltransferase [Acidobacteriota bacterium]|nr:GNAT family N-acetyltransferase [Acidobacteriota bacterium]